MSHDVVERDLLVGLLLVALEHIEPIAALHLGAHLLEVKSIGAVCIVAAIARCGLVVVGDEDRARHAPVGDVGLAAGLGLALGSSCSQCDFRCFDSRKFADSGWKSRLPISTTPGENGATTVPTISGRGFWNGFAMKPTPSSSAAVRAKSNLEAVVGEIDVVGRIALPDRQDDVDRFGENLVAVLHRECRAPRRRTSARRG